MEQITHYFEHMDYVSFGVIALPCVIIAVYGFLQVASGLAKVKNDKMQRYNDINISNASSNRGNQSSSNGSNNNNNHNSNNNNNNNNNNNSSSNNKRCAPKSANGNLAAIVGQEPPASGAANSHYQQQPLIGNNGNTKAMRKARNNKRQDGQGAAATAAYNLQKRAAAAGNNTSWPFVTSSCIEEKYLVQHNPGHRNSTSSEATSEDINSSDEQSNKSKCGLAKGDGRAVAAAAAAIANSGRNSGNNKKRTKRQQKALARQTAQTTTLMQLQFALNQPAKEGNTKYRQGKWRNNSNSNGSGSNNNNNNNNNNNGNGNGNGSGNNGKRANGKGKQRKCNSNSRNNNNKDFANGNGCTMANIGDSNKIGGAGGSGGVESINKCNNSNSSSAVSSPGSSPNGCSSSSSSSGVGGVGGKGKGDGGGDVGRGSSSSNTITKYTCSSMMVWQYEGRQNPYRSYQPNVNFLVPPLRQYERLLLDDETLQRELRRHLIDRNLMRVYGFPVASVVHEGAIEIFKCLPPMNFTEAHLMSMTDTAMTVINCDDGLNCQVGLPEEAGADGDNVENNTIADRTDNNIPDNGCSSETSSSNGDGPTTTSTDSGNISPHSLDSESAGEWSGSECESAPNAEANYGMEVFCSYPTAERSLAKQCVRCKRDFLVDEQSGQYLTREECVYHWGKYHRCYNGSNFVTRWTCCNADEESAIGCAHHDLHVWTGSVVGLNGPYHDFVKTQPRPAGSQSQGGRPRAAVYALDCEMSYTGRGLDVTKVSVVALNGQLVYEHYVRPDADIVDYNTKYSGITANDLKSNGCKTLADVQRDLLDLIDADTILIGHGLDNDLRALRLVHNTLIDTSIAFPHANGFPYRRALRNLIKTHLNREIQKGDGTTGHSSFEDSRACMELMLWRVRREYGNGIISDDKCWQQQQQQQQQQKQQQLETSVPARPAGGMADNK